MLDLKYCKFLFSNAEQSIEELAFEGLIDTDLSAVKSISSHGGDLRIEEPYSQLRDWVHGSLDKYKVLPFFYLPSPKLNLSLG